MLRVTTTSLQNASVGKRAPNPFLVRVCFFGAAVQHGLMFSKISPQQIKAARALLEWSQTDLGEKTGLSQAAIANIETARHRPNDTTLDSLLTAFDQAGIEFIDGGVRLRPDSLEIIEGEDIAARMPDIYFETLLHSGAEEVMINGVDFSIMDKTTGQVVLSNIERLKAAGKRQRVLVREGTPVRDILGPLSWHRALPAHLFSAVTPSLVYHNCFAIMLFDKKQVMIIRNGNLAEYQKRQFDFLWDSARPLG